MAMTPANTRSGTTSAKTSHNGANPESTTVMTTTHSESLSASGSSHCPTVEIWFNRRAKNPSIQSVEKSTISVSSALQYSSRNMNHTKTGASRNLSSVTRLGTVNQSSVTVGSASSSDGGVARRFIQSSKRSVSFR